MKYEGLVADFKVTMTGIMSLLGEEYHPAMERYYKQKRKRYLNKIAGPPSPFGKNHPHYRNWQINQPLFDGRECGPRSGG